MADGRGTLGASSSGRAVDLRFGPFWLEDMTVTADRDPYFAFPKLYGAPAYARPPRVVDDGERPMNPDDLPIVAEQTEEERAAAAALLAAGSDGSSGDAAWRATAAEGSTGDRTRTGARRFGFRALANRNAPRDR